MAAALGQAAPVHWRWLVWVSVASGVSFALPTPARAQAVEQALRIQYTAPDTCPDAASFAAQLRQRTARGRFAEPGELARTFDVELSADAQGYSGNVEFLGDGGAKVSRHVHGEQCDAVVSSLALITALAVDATLPSEDSEPVAKAEEPTPALQPSAEPSPAPVTPTQSSPSSVTSRRALEGVRLGVLAGYGGTSSAPVLGLLGQLDFRSSFSLRLMAHYGWHEFTVDPGRSAHLQRLGLETGACLRRFRRAAFSAVPCATVDLGSLQAGGVPSERLDSTRDQTIWWASVGVQLALSWEPDAPFWVELRAAGELPLRAGYQFTFENPHAIAYQVPYVSGWGGVATGVRF